MLHWKWIGVAMYPGQSIENLDHYGCWTGTAQLDTDGTPTILYTGVRSKLEKETQLIATASDSNITSWVKSLQNPVLERPPREYFFPNQISGFRDPTFWFDNEYNFWRLFIGSGLKNLGGMVLQYESSSLYGPWNFTKPLLFGNATNHGDMWECPDFFPLSSVDGTVSKWVLLFGDDSKQKNYYFIGEFDKSKQIFIPSPQFAHPTILDAGNFYACKTALDKNGNRFLYGWSPEDRSVSEYSAAGWAGIQTIPRRLVLANDAATLLFYPLPLDSLGYAVD